MKKTPSPSRKNEPLSRHTSMRVGGPVRNFYEPSSIEELSGILKHLRGKRQTFFVLGGGTNLIAADRPKTKNVISMKKIVGFHVQGSKVTVSAGESLQKLVARTAKLGLSGLEGLAGIPGTVGGALAMNAGGRWGCVSDPLVWIEAVDALGRVRRFQKREMLFSYRKGPFRKRIIVRSGFDLERKNKNVYAEFTDIRKKKSLSQPLGARNAGCIFLNPPGKSAGELIDRAGLKKKAVGGAAVSAKHANFIVNRGRARAKDVKQLIDSVRKKVYNDFCIRLQTEVIFLE